MKSQELTGGPERNYGIDLMRIVSMLMVLTLHVLGQGGVLGSTRLFTVKNQLAWLMEVGAYGAVVESICDTLKIHNTNQSDI